MNGETLESIADLFHPLRVAVAVGVVILVWAGLALLRRSSARLVERFPRHRLLISSAFPVFRLAVWLAAAGFVVLAVLKPPLNTVLALSATAGVAVGFGAQDLVRNVIAGLLLLVERPFSVGDMIRVGDDYGEVTNIGLRSVRLRTFDDSAVTVPNQLLVSGPVSNNNSGSLQEMVTVDLTLPASVDTRTVKEVAEEAALCSPYADRGRPVVVLVADRFDLVPLTVFTVKSYVVDVRYERLLASDIVERMKEELAARGIPGPESAARAAFLPA